MLLKPAIKILFSREEERWWCRPVPFIILLLLLCFFSPPLPPLLLLFCSGIAVQGGVLGCAATEAEVDDGPDDDLSGSLRPDDTP